MAGLRSNGYTISLVALAFVVCFIAIDRYFGQTSQAVATTGFLTMDFDFDLESAPNLICPVSQDFDTAVYQQLAQVEPGFHHQILQICNPPPTVPVPNDPIPVDPQHDENDDDETASSAVRNVIERELSHTSREERDIWYDELKTLPAGVVRDLLQVRKQLRALPRLLGGAPEKLASTDLSGTHSGQIVAEPVSQKIRFQAPDDYSTTSALEGAIAQLRHNLVNASTPGFKRLRVTLVDSYAPVSLDQMVSHQFDPGLTAGTRLRGEGCRMAPLQLDLKQGTLKSTGRQLDLAIEGDGFFVVRHGEKELLTRCGAFALDRDRQLVLTVAETSVLVQPAIKIPQDSREIQISADGTVVILKSSDATLSVIGRIPLARVASPARLQPLGQTLYLANDDSGPIETGPAMTEGYGEIQQGFLEQSNVEFQTELDEIEELTMILKALPLVPSRPVTASGPQTTPAR